MGFWLASCKDHINALLRKVARENPEMVFLGRADVSGKFVCDLPICREKAIWELYFTERENAKNMKKELKKYGHRNNG